MWTSFYYGQVQYALSQARKGYAFGGGPTGTGSNGAISPAAIQRQQQYTVNLVYDPNPAIRLGLEYAYITSHYARNLYAQASGSLTSEGKVNMVRFAAQYFF